MQNGNGKHDAGQKVNGKDESIPMLTEPNILDEMQRDKKSVEDEFTGLPVDRGWAWMVLLGAVWEVIIYGGLMKCYGVFFVQYQKRFGSSASETTLIQTLFNVSFSISGIFVMTVGMQHMSTRTSVCIGGLLTSMSYAICAFAWRIEILIFFLGAVAGVAGSMIFLPVVSSVSTYFNEYRGMANSINMAGASLGALVFGPLYSTLFEYYGYTGTMLISSGLLLNILVSGCLLRPPEWFTKRVDTSSAKRLNQSGMPENHPSESEQFMRKTEQELQLTNSDKLHNGINFSGSGVILHKTAVMASGHISNGTLHNGTNTSRGRVPLLLRTISGPTGGNVSKEAEHQATLNFPEVKGNRIRSISECKHHVTEFPALNKLDKTNLSLYSNIDSLTGSLVSLGTRYAQVNNSVKDGQSTDLNQPNAKGCRNSFKGNVVKFLQTIFNPSVLRDPVFIHFIVMSFVSFSPSVIAPVYFVPFANEIGISSDNMNILLVLIGCTDLISRITVGVIVDRKWLKPTTMVALAYVILGIVHNLTRLIHSFSAMVTFVLIESSLTGVYIALFAVILVENLGIEKFKSALGFTSMSHGATCAAFFPITGMLRDTTGAYHWTYSLLSILVLIGAVLALALPITHRKCHKVKSMEKIIM